MCLRNSLQTYGGVTKLLHWLMAVLIIGVLVVGLIVADMEKGPEKAQLVGMHKEFGIVILFLACVRFGWKIFDVSPLLPVSMSKKAIWGAKIVHLSLYALMFALPLSGWIMSSAFGREISMFGLFDMPMIMGEDKEFGREVRELHELFADTFMALLALHVSAVFVHYFHYKDDILQRMLPQCWKK